MAQGKRDSCVCCDHDQRIAIDRAIMAGDSLRDIATMFKTSKDAVHRHKTICLQRGAIPVTPTEAPVEPPEYKTAVEVAKNEDLRKWSKGILGKAISFMNAAESSGDLRTAVSAVREARGCIELLGRVQGDLGPNTAVQVNTAIVQNPGPPPPPLPPEAARQIAAILAKYHITGVE